MPLSFFFEEDEAGMQELVVSCANVHGRKVHLKFLQLKVILTDSQTQEDYEIEIT